MKVEMTLAPGTESKPVESLVLDIPIAQKRAQLFHVSTTGLRSNPAGAVPAGKGEVWNSASFPDGQWIGNFKPYVWIGDGERGVAFFADNDAGWELNLLDEKKQVYAPCQQILRGEDGTVTLRVNLIQRATTITQPRKIVFGLMATPAKPMTENWRRITLNNHVEGCLRVMFMGSQYWGSDMHCAAKYPRNGDLSVLDAIQTQRRRAPFDAQKFIADWSGRHFAPDMPTHKTKEMMTSLVGTTLQWAYDTPPDQRYTVYFDEFHSTSSLHPEVPVFGSEWSGQYGYGTVGAQVRSHQDFACWYGAEFVKRGIGLYFDNAFLKRGLDPLTSAAYRTPDGRIQPSSSMWAHREYLRRIWTIHRELSPADMQTFMLIHVTNAEIAPYTVWNDANLDLEWMYGPEPKQAIYTPELLRTESTGFVSGNAPYVLARVSNTTSKEQEAFVYRSRFGSMMVHEIHPEAMSNEEVEMFKKFLAFGYGLEDCKVHRYWEDEFPLRVTDDRVKTLMLERGDKRLILACSWNVEPMSVRVDLSGAKLPGGGVGCKVTNVESDKAPVLTLDAKQELPLELEGYGVKIIEIAPAN